MKKHRMTFTGLAILIFQILSLLPLPYIFMATGSYQLIMSKGILSLLFDLAATALPRPEVLLISFIYRKTLNEIVVFFLFPAIALLAGLVTRAMLRYEGPKARAARYLLALFCLTDLIVRILPVSFNKVYPVPYQVLGFLVALACLVLIVIDILKKRSVQS